jgi:hypothetical protein
MGSIRAKLPREELLNESVADFVSYTSLIPLLNGFADRITQSILLHIANILMHLIVLTSSTNVLGKPH